MGYDDGGDGQHRSGSYSGAPGPETGQRGRLDPRVKVGQLSGGENQMNVPGCPASDLVSTTVGAVESDPDRNESIERD